MTDEGKKCRVNRTHEKLTKAGVDKRMMRLIDNQGADKRNFEEAEQKRRAWLGNLQVRVIKKIGAR